MKLKFELASKARKDQRIIQYEFDERLLKARLNDCLFQNGYYNERSN